MRVPQQGKLSAEEELSLIRLAQSHSPSSVSAVNLLFETYRPLIGTFVRRYRRKGNETDLENEGRVGFLEALRRFDPSKGARLSTYAVFWIKKRVREYITSVDEQKSCISIFDKVPFLNSSGEVADLRWIDRLNDGFCEDDLIRELDFVDLRRSIQSAFKTLSPRQRAVIQLLFWGDRSKSEIARQLGISPARVSRLLKFSYIKLGERLDGYREMVSH